MDKRAALVSGIVGHEVSSVDKLSRAEAVLLMRRLVSDSEAKAKAAFPEGEASGF